MSNTILTSDKLIKLSLNVFFLGCFLACDVEQLNFIKKKKQTENQKNPPTKKFNGFCAQIISLQQKYTECTQYKNIWKRTIESYLANIILFY